MAGQTIGPLAVTASQHPWQLRRQEVIKYHNERRRREYVELVRPHYLLVFPDWETSLLQLGIADNPQRYELVSTYEGGTVQPHDYQLFRVHY
jgi:hypothetical protein